MEQKKSPSETNVELFPTQDEYFEFISNGMTDNEKIDRTSYVGIPPED